MQGWSLRLKQHEGLSAAAASAAPGSFLLSRAVEKPPTHLLHQLQAQLLVSCPEVVGGIGPRPWVVEGASSGGPELPQAYLTGATQVCRQTDTHACLQRY